MERPPTTWMQQDQPQPALPPLPNVDADRAAPFLLPAGAALYHAGQPGRHAWQLVHGCMRLDDEAASRERFVQLTLAGELLGTEPWLGLPHACTARALTDCKLHALRLPDCVALPVWLGHALCQQARRAAQMVGLRTGSAPERVRRLLLLLSTNADHGGPQTGQSDHVLPRIKDIATIVDTTPETVSRIISSLRRSRVLLGRHARFACFDAAQLAGLTLPPGMTSSGNHSG